MMKRFILLILLVSLICTGCICKDDMIFEALVMSVFKGEKSFGIDVIIDNNKIVPITLPLVFTDDTFFREASDEIFDLTMQNRKVKVELVEPFDKNGFGTGFVYLNNQDLSVFLIQKGLLKVDLNSKYK